MIWYTLYLIAGLITAGVVLLHIRDMRKHAEDCDQHPDARKVLNQIDSSPALLPILVLLTVALWWYVVTLYAKAYFSNDDDDDDPQANVPPMYR